MNLHRPVSDSSASCHWLKWFSDQRHFAAAVWLWCWNTAHFQHLAKVGRTMKKRLIFQSTFYWDIATCIAGAIDVGARCGPKAGWTMGVFEVHGANKRLLCGRQVEWSGCRLEPWWMTSHFFFEIVLRKKVTEESGKVLISKSKALLRWGGGVASQHLCLRLSRPHGAGWRWWKWHVAKLAKVQSFDQNNTFLPLPLFSALFLHGLHWNYADK